jgi:hypothetical protein
MALVPCRECGKEVSDAAEKCPYCGISTPSKKRRQVKLGITLIVILLIIGASAWAYHRVSQAFAPAASSDSTVVAPKIQKDIPVKQQIIQKDYKDKIRELLDSGESVASISKQTGIRKDEIRRIKKEMKDAEKAKAK